MDLKSIPLDSDYWKNPPLPSIKSQDSWMNRCLELTEKILADIGIGF